MAVPQTRTGTMITRLKNRKEFSTSPQARERLNQLEAKLRAKMADDKGLKIAFGQVQTYWERVKSMTPAQQEAERKSIRLQAEDTFAGYFNQVRTDNKEDLDTYVSRLNRDFKFATADEEMALKEKMAGLDRDTTSAIGAAFRDVINRGLGNSGALQSITSQITSQRQIAADQVQKISDIATRNLDARKEDRGADLTRSMERSTRDLSLQEELTTQNEESNIFQNRVMGDLYRQEAAGVNELAPRSMLEAALPDPLDPLQVRINNQTNPAGQVMRPVSQEAIKMNNVQDRRNNRIARNNLAANARR